MRGRALRPLRWLSPAKDASFYSSCSSSSLFGSSLSCSRSASSCLSTATLYHRMNSRGIHTVTASRTSGDGRSSGRSSNRGSFRGRGASEGGKRAHLGVAGSGCACMLGVGLFLLAPPTSPAPASGDGEEGGGGGGAGIIFANIFERFLPGGGGGGRGDDSIKGRVMTLMQAHPTSYAVALTPCTQQLREFVRTYTLPVIAVCAVNTGVITTIAITVLTNLII